MKNFSINKKENKRTEELHWETQQWKSDLQFVEDEIIFIEQLLNSYAFEPNTPNLFERLQHFLKHLEHFKKRKSELVSVLAKDDNDLGRILESTDNVFETAYYKKHDELRSEMKSAMKQFQQLKLEIFNYTGGILRN